MMNISKRSYPSSSDMNNNEIVSSPSTEPKKKKCSITPSKSSQSYTIGQIKEIRMLNFMCHKNFGIKFRSTPMQIVTGANGSGKSAIANAICLCLGAQARTTGRTTNVQSFIRKGETYAELTITLANEGLEAYKPEIYGKEIHITRRINAKSSTYKVFNLQRKVISTQKDTIAEIIQALSISPDNPLCILHQEVAKTFLLNNDAQKKYQFYMKVSQLDQIKQAHEDALCTVQSISQRINGMTQRYLDLLRTIEPYEREIKKIDDRRNKEVQQRELELELNSARIQEYQQEIANVKIELDQTQKTRDILEKKLDEAEKKINDLNKAIEEGNNDRNDIEKDLFSSNGLRELNVHFAKQKTEIEVMIRRLSNQCESQHQILKELEEEEQRLNKQINEFQTLSQQSNHENLEREKFEHDLDICQQKQIDIDKQTNSLLEELNLINDNLKKKQSTLHCIQNEVKQKHQDIDEFKKLEQGQTNVYGPWMYDCLKAIESDTRFHRKPIGPIGRHIRCTETRWSYAVEKHLASIMRSFICSDRHDEKILLDIFRKYCPNSRPHIHVRKYSNQIHDVSGTLERVRRANLLCIHDVLAIDNPIVACFLIDDRQIEATILLENLQEAKRIHQKGIVRWDIVRKKVKQVTEAWTYDGSNIKLDKTFRIYTNDRQPARYFTSNNTQSLSIEELEGDLKRLNEEIQQTNMSIDQLKKIRQKTNENLEYLKKSNIENKIKIKHLNKELERHNSTMPTACAYSLDELKEKLYECTRAQKIANEKFNEAKDNKETKHLHLNEIKQRLDNIVKKMEEKTKIREDLVGKITETVSEKQEVQQQIPKLMKKIHQLNEDTKKYQDKFNDLIKNQPKKTKILKTTNRSVREIQQELNTISNYLKSQEDTREKRQQIIEDYRIKRQNVQALKKLRDHCQRQNQRLETFVNKRKERFGQIADQHKYLLRHKFRDLMSQNQFEDCDIDINHKKEELHIIIKKNQRSVASLSGGERSISTFCFLLALWGSIYQPFRLLDEIDIYMDNEKRNSSLQLLHQYTKSYHSSQHIILTPQAIDQQTWDQLNVPVFRMSTPKRSLE